MLVKALSLWQPHATLMAVGAKRNETRSWGTEHRGWLVIHAAKRWTPAQRQFAQHPRVAKALKRAGYESPDLLPRGRLLAAVYVERVVRSSPELDRTLSADEACFGEYGDGRFVWVTTCPLPIEPPIVRRGRQGLFEVEIPDDVLPRPKPWRGCGRDAKRF